MKNIHLINEEKITIRIIELFEKADPTKNLYIIFKKNHEIENLHSYKSVIYDSEFDSTIYVDYQNILVHFLDIKKVKFIKDKLRKKSKIYWFIWGGDIYNRPEVGFSIFSLKTFLIVLRLRPLKEFLRFLSNPLRGNILSMGEIKKFSKNITHLATIFNQDSQKAIEIFNLNSLIKPFIYYSLPAINDEEVLNKLHVNTCCNILLGNSGHPTNNHIDILVHLSKNLESFNEVYVPLNYGDNKYIDYIIKVGKELLGEKFKPLTTFLSLEDYNQILKNCDIAIFNSYRQQAFGNVVSLLAMGKTIYLQEKNAIFQYLKSNDLHLFEMQTLFQNFEILQISKFERIGNHQKSYQLFSEEKLVELTKNLIDG